ncbi:MAG: helix-turn-helix domain-containing protein [Nitrospirae bacterium]|nr:helix-turn-helix domain-containing protein [Nitrospirota bacterium]
MKMIIHRKVSTFIITPVHINPVLTPVILKFPTIVVSKVMCTDISAIHGVPEVKELVQVEVTKAPEILPIDINYISIDNTILYTQTRESLYLGEFIRGDLYYKDISTASGSFKGVIQLKSAHMDNGVYLGRDRMNELDKFIADNIDGYCDLSADVLDIINSLWIKSAKSFENTITVTVDDILHSRGLLMHKSGEGRRGGYNEESRKQIANQIELLSNIWITVHDYMVTEDSNENNGKKKRTSWKFQTRLIVVSSRLTKNENNDGEYTYGWVIRPGDVFGKLLMGASRQTALLPSVALEYDYDKFAWEKRLTRYFAALWRIRQRAGAYAEPIRVETILKKIGKVIYEKNPLRTKQRLESALDNLQKDGVIVSWCYYGLEKVKVGKRGWCMKWLDCKIVIQPPPTIIDNYKNIKLIDNKQPKQQCNIIMNSILTVKDYRESRGLTLTELARELGVSISTLSRIERGYITTGAAFEKLMERVRRDATHE